MGILNLFIKDVKMVAYDVKTLAIIVIMPVVLMSILGMALRGVFGDETGISEKAIIGIAMEAEGPFGDALISTLESEDLKGFITYEKASYEEGLKKLSDLEYDALLRIPKDFYTTGNLDYINGTRSTVLSGIAESFMTEYAFMAGAAISGIELTGETVEIEEQNVRRTESISSFQYYSAAIMSMFLLYAAGIGGRAVLEEKRENTLKRTLVTGEGIKGVLISNFLRVMAIVMLQSIVMILFSSLVLRVRWGSPVTLLATMIFSGFAIASIGTFIAVISLKLDNFRVANIFEFVIVYFMTLIGGSFLPIQMLPKIIQKLDFLSISGQSLKMYINSMYNLPLSKSYGEMVTLIIYGLVFSLVAYLIAKRGGDLA